VLIVFVGTPVGLIGVAGQIADQIVVLHREILDQLSCAAKVEIELQNFLQAPIVVSYRPDCSADRIVRVLSSYYSEIRSSQFERKKNTANYRSVARSLNHRGGLASSDRDSLHPAPGHSGASGVGWPICNQALAPHVWERLLKSLNPRRTPWSGA
jgi:hypothetical protein